MVFVLQGNYTFILPTEVLTQAFQTCLRPLFPDEEYTGDKGREECVGNILQFQLMKLVNEFETHYFSLESKGLQQSVSQPRFSFF